MSYEEELKEVSERLVSFSEGKLVKGWNATVDVVEDNRRFRTTETSVIRDGSTNLFKFMCKKSKRTGERKFSPIVSEVVAGSTAKPDEEKVEKFKEYVGKNVNVISDYENWKTIKADIKKSDQSLITGTGFEISEELRDIEDRINNYSEEDYELLISDYALALSEKAVSYLVNDSFNKKRLEDLKEFKKNVELGIKAAQLNSENFRKFIKDVMVLSKTRKIETPLGSLFLSKKDSLKITDDSKVPDECKVVNITFTVPLTCRSSAIDMINTAYNCDIKEEIKVDKDLVEKFVRENTADWAEISKQVSLQIRKKGAKKDETETDKN